MALILDRIGETELVRHGAFHDAHEAVTSDIPRPFKCECLKKIQNDIDKRIGEAFGLRELQRFEKMLIKSADDAALAAEAVVVGPRGVQKLFQSQAVEVNVELVRMLSKTVCDPRSTALPDSKLVTSFAAAFKKEFAVVDAVKMIKEIWLTNPPELPDS